MSKIIRLTEADLMRLVKSVINEQKEEWHYFAKLRDILKPKGFIEDKSMNSIGWFTLAKGNDWNGVFVQVKPTTGECVWGASKNGKNLLNKKYKMNLQNTANIGVEGKKVMDMIIKDISPYIDMKFGPAPTEGSN